MNFNINMMSNLQCISSSLDSLVKNFGKDDSKYLSQEFHSDVLDVVKQKVFYPDEHVSRFENFNKRLPTEEKFYSSLTDKKISYKEYEHVLKQNQTN